MALRLVLVIVIAACRAPSSATAPEEIVNVAVDASVREIALRVGDEVPLSGRVEFDYDDDTLRRSAFPILDEVVAFLRAHPELLVVEIQGHLAADRDREPYGRVLSRDRAEAVRDYLIHRGVDPDRLTTKGYEETRPLVPYDDPDAAITNRRIELWIVSVADDRSAPRSGG